MGWRSREVMRDKMKTNRILKKITGFAVSYVPIALGFVVGVVTIYRFEKLIDGILGVATIFFIYLLFSPEKISIFKRAPMQVADEQIIKYSAADFFLAIIVYWSAHRVIDTIFGIIKIYSG
jgi:hypothetical protein